MKYSDYQIRKLSIAFSQIDFSQPGAHEVFHNLRKTLESFMTNPDFVTEREYWFFKLGRSANIKMWEFNHIPPINVKDSISEGKIE